MQMPLEVISSEGENPMGEEYTHERRSFLRPAAPHDAARPSGQALDADRVTADSVGATSGGNWLATFAALQPLA